MRWGAASFDISCNAVDALAALQGEAIITWIEEAACANEQTHYTSLLLSQSICHAVPAAPGSTAGNTGYKITCDAAGTSGTFQTCSSSDCSSCSTSMPFTNAAGQMSGCLANPNPAQTGSASVRFGCAARANNVAEPVNSPAPDTGAPDNQTSISGAARLTVGGVAAFAAAAAAATHARMP